MEDKGDIILRPASVMVEIFTAFVALGGGSFFGAVSTFFGLPCLQHLLNFVKGEAF